MNHHFRRLLLRISLFCLFLFFTTAAGAQQPPVVRAILFYSPTCPHCHQVINEVLLPLVGEHGDRLQIVAIDVSQAGGQELYQSAITYFPIPEERLGVPTLVVGDTVLVGSGEIPALFPGIVENGLAAGIDWPAIPGFNPPLAPAPEAADPGPEPTMTLAAATATASPEATIRPTATPMPASGSAAGETPPPLAENLPPATALPEGAAPLLLDAEQINVSPDDAEEPPADPLGFALAAAILVGMVLACAFVAWRLVIIIPAWRQAGHAPGAPKLSWAIPLIAALGIGVGVYLAYVEITQVKAVCGPVGHCNLVQSSSYARILGIPIALLGIGAYLAIIGLWVVHRIGVTSGGHERGADSRDWALAGLIGMTIFGTLFSIYLTLLELFVIRAVCAWCLTSAVAMTILTLLVVNPMTTKRQLLTR